MRCTGKRHHVYTSTRGCTAVITTAAAVAVAVAAAAAAAANPSHSTYIPTCGFATGDGCVRTYGEKVLYRLGSRLLFTAVLDVGWRWCIHSTAAALL